VSDVTLFPTALYLLVLYLFRWNAYVDRNSDKSVYQSIYLFLSRMLHTLSVSQRPSIILSLISTHAHAHTRSLSPSSPLSLPPHTLTHPPLHTIPVSLEHVPLNRRYHEKRSVTGAEWWMRHHVQWLWSSALLVLLHAPAMLCCILLPDDDVIFLNLNAEDYTPDDIVLYILIYPFISFTY
jgi:hypothetical protein